MIRCLVWKRAEKREEDKGDPEEEDEMEKEQAEDDRNKVSGSVLYDADKEMRTFEEGDRKDAQESDGADEAFEKLLRPNRFESADRGRARASMSLEIV